MNNTNFPFYMDDHILLLSKYRTPDLHSHLAIHLFVSDGDYAELKLENETVKARAVVVASEVLHTASADKNLITFLFDETSNAAAVFEDIYLQGKDYAILEEKTSENLVKAFGESKGDLKNFDEKSLEILGLERAASRAVDDRITAALHILEKMESVDRDAMATLSDAVCLSQSRFSHLFKENMGIAFNRYLVLVKMKKTYAGFIQGKSLTDACTLAGFDSASHMASTMNRMFGISFSDFKKSI